MDAFVRKTRLFIGGMTCVNCQNRIEKELNRTEGIIKAGVSYSRGTADIVYDESKISLKEIAAVVERLDYEVLPDRRRQEPGVVRVIAMLAVIAALYVMLQSMGILNLLAPSQVADTKMGYGMLFVVGLITSVHCIAMCGGINISQCIPQAGQSGTENGRTGSGGTGNVGRLDTLRPALSYNLGRVVSYTAVGFVMGLAGLLAGGGAEVGLPAFFQGILKIIAGLFMVIMGINMLGLFPWLRRFTIRMPGFLAQRIGEKKLKSSRPFLVGVLNGFMPCGPLQSMWIVALASGNPVTGAVSMFLFSLGTVPLMLGLGSVVSALGKRFTDKVMTVGAVLVTVLGLAMLSQGGSLSGLLPPDLLMALVFGFGIAGVLVSIPVRKRLWRDVLEAAALAAVIGSYALWNFQGTAAQANPAADVETEVVDGTQVVSSTLTPGRFPNITVQAGIPVKWIIDVPQGSLNGCNYRIMIRDYGITYTFHTGENVIEFTPDKTGTVRYSCWMGMIRGNIFVTDGTEEYADLSGAGVTVPTPAGYEIPTDRIAVASLETDQNGTEYQQVNIALTEEGFSPAVVVVQSGLLTIWNIDNQLEDDGYGTDFLVPYYATQLVLGEGTNQLSLYSTESFDASTGDNRFYCYVKVVDDLSAVDEAAVREEAAAFETMIYPAELFESPGMSCCGY